MKATVSPGRAMFLLVRLRLTRLLNLSNASFTQSKSRGTKRRQPTLGKRRVPWLLATALFLIMGLSFSHLGYQGLLNMHCHFDIPALCLPSDASQMRQMSLAALASGLRSQPFSMEMIYGLSMQISLLFCVSVFIPLATRELSAPDWDLEWLVTMPFSRGSLLSARLIERAVVNPVALLALPPMCGLIAWLAGFGWAAIPLAACASLVLLVLAALLRTLVDTGLRLQLNPSQLQNLQAVLSVCGTLFMLLAMSFGTGPGASFTFKLAREFPAWAVWLPPGLAVQAVSASTATEAATFLALLGLQVGLLLYCGIALLRYQLRQGVVAAGGRESSRRPMPAKQQARARTWNWGTIVQRREIRLLSRDRNFLVQTLFLPIIIVLGQPLINGQLSGIAQIGNDPKLMALIAFGLGVYVLMMSAMQTINTEGSALWMLYSFPRSLEDILKEKAQLWAALTLIYPLVIFSIGIASTQSLGWELAGLILLVLLGIPIYSVIAVAIGVFASDPMAQEAQNKLRPSYVYLYMLLSGLYSYAIYAGAWWQKLVCITLSTTLALALWQKARAELPYLLDPAASPPARVSMADGLIAAMIYFLLQSIGMAMLGARETRDPLHELAVFAGAGAISFVLVRYSYWRLKTSGIPRLLPPAPVVAMKWGVSLGLCAAIFGVVYMVLLRSLDDEFAASAASEIGVMGRIGLIGLTVVVAPLVEEFIFRGLIFAGLRTSINAGWSAIASAAIFAIVHPPLSMLPVFILGLATAFAYERTRSLLASMMVHALYNAVIVTMHLNPSFWP